MSCTIHTSLESTDADPFIFQGLVEMSALSPMRNVMIVQLERIGILCSYCGKLFSASTQTCIKN
jgi:hypothetical protein